MKRRIACAVGAAFAATAGTTGPSTALAQGTESRVLDEIVVTARFREETLQQTPIAITAITAEAIELKSLGQISDIGAVVPNAYIRRQGTNQGPTPVIGMRGVVASQFDFSGEPGVAVYIDDVYHGTLLGSSFDLLDLERVEVLRGPQGTLFGKNTLGGAIRAVSRRPQGDGSGYLEATYGDYDRLDLKGAYDFALVEDRLFMRVTGLSKARDGYQDRLDFTCEMIRRGTPELAGIGDGWGADGSAGEGFDGRPDQVPVGSDADNAFFLPMSLPGLNPERGCKIGTQGGESIQAGRIMLRYVASPRMELNFAADVTRDRSEAPANSLIYLLSDPDPDVPNTLSGGVDNRVINAHGVPAVPFGDTYNRTRPPWSQAATYTDLNFRIPMDDRFMTGDPFTTYTTFADPVSGAVYPDYASVEAWGASGGLDAALSDLVDLKLVASYRQYDSEFTDDRDHSPLGVHTVYTIAEHEQTSAELQLSGRLLDRLDWTVGAFYYRGTSYWGGSPQLLDSSLGAFNHNDTAKTRNHSAFAHLVYDLTDSMAVTAGARYSDESKDYHFDHRPSVRDAVGDAHTSGSRFDWKVGLDYQLNDQVMTYGQIASGFRSEAFNVRIFTIEQLINTEMPAEELISYEVGVKGDWFDRRLRTNIAAFYSDYKTRIITQGGMNECPPYTTPVPTGTQCPPDSNLPPGNTTGIPWPGYATSAPADIYGVELELTARPTDELTVDGTLGWLKFKSDDVHRNNRIQPEWNASIGAQYAFPLPNGGTLVPRLDAFYQGHMTFSPTTATPPTDFDVLDGYWLMNGRVTYETPGREWSASLAVTNLTDKFYYYTWFGSGANFRTGAPGRPREWAITLRRSFR